MFTDSQKAWAAGLVGEVGTAFPQSQAGQVRTVFDVGNGRAVVVAVGVDGPIVWASNAPSPTAEEAEAGGEIQSANGDSFTEKLVAIETARVAAELVAMADLFVTLIAERYTYVAPIPVEGPRNDPARVEPPITEDAAPAK